MIIFYKYCRTLFTTMDHTVNLFEKFRNSVFDDRLSYANFVKKHLEIYPTNLFELNSRYDGTIFHVWKHDEDFVKWCLQQWPTNIFGLRDIIGRTIFHQNISNKSPKINT
jgi:hypothetical protein